MKIAFFSTNTSFCEHLLEELSRSHTLKLWEQSPNVQLGWANTLKLLDWCDVAYLEWMQLPNIEISRIQALNKPLIVFCHGRDVMYHTSMDWRSIEGLIIQDAQYPRLLRLRAEWTKNTPHLPLPKLPKKTLIKSLGVDLQTFLPPRPSQELSSYHIVVHASWIRPVKRIYAAIQQFYDLIQLDGDKPWKMTLIGRWKGGYEHPTLAPDERWAYLTACNELIEQLDFPPGRIYLKPENFPREIWAQFAKTVDVYWCTSAWESFGVSMAEVCACGGYPLVNDYLGADKVYPEKYRCKTPYEMIQKTIEWGNLGSEEKAKERHAIRKHMEQYDAKQAAKEIRVFIEDVVENYKR